MSAPQAQITNVAIPRVGSLLLCAFIVGASVLAGCGSASASGKSTTAPEQKVTSDDKNSHTEDTGLATGGSDEAPASPEGAKPGEGKYQGDKASDAKAPAAAAVPTEKNPAPVPSPKPPVAASTTAKLSAKVNAVAAAIESEAKAAAKVSAWARAIPLYQALVEAHGRGGAHAMQLAEAWVQAGEIENALEVLTIIRENAESEDLRDRATALYNRNSNRVVMFQDQGFNLQFSMPLAKRAFTEGDRAIKSKKYDDALILYKMGSSLLPQAPGFLRKIGNAYDKLGQKAERREYYLRYLHRLPFGKNSDEVRASLKKEKGVFASVDITSPWPCEVFWLNGQPAEKLPPYKKLQLAPGNYRLLCISYQYKMGYSERFTVKAGEQAKIQLKWALVVNKLERPYGRLLLEHAGTGKIKDLGISQPTYGVYVPDDGRPLRMVLRADDGSRQEERMIKLEPGQTAEIRW